MRVLRLLILCGLLVWQMPSAFAAGAEPASWPDHGPYRLVGDPNEGYEVKLPVPAVEALRLFVPVDPSRWSISKIDFPGQRRQLVQITGKTNGYATLIRYAGYWVNLSAPESVPFLNKVLERLQPADIRDREKLEDYLYLIVFLQKYYLSKFLTPHLRRERFTTRRLIDMMRISEEDRRALRAKDPDLNRPAIDSWLEGTEKSRRVLLALFHDFEVSKVATRVTVRENLMSPEGAMGEWTFHSQVDQAVRLESVNVREIYKEGTFSFPLIL